MQVFNIIGSKIKNIKTNIKKNAANIITTGIGAAALGIVITDANYIGKLQADVYAGNQDANSTMFYLNNTLYSTNMSKFQDNIKETSYRSELDQGYKRFFNEIKGYIKGFFSMLVSNIVPFALGLVAVFNKGLPSKISAGGLGAYGVYEFLKNFFGFGAPKGPSL